MTTRSFTLDAEGDHAVLLLHGLTGAPSEMFPIGKQLRRAGATIHAPLIAGHGEDSAALLSTNWRHWLRSAQEGYDLLARDHAHVHVAGICLGAMLAVALAVQRRVASVAAYGTTFRYDGWSMPRAARRRRLITMLAGLPGVRSIGVPESEPYGIKDPELRAMMVAAQRRANGGSVDSFPLGSIRQLYLLADHVEAVAPGVRAPVLILHAREDDISSVRNAEKLRARLGGDARVELLDDSYHLIHLDREADSVAAKTAAFFELPCAARLLSTARMAEPAV